VRRLALLPGPFKRIGQGLAMEVFEEVWIDFDRGGVRFGPRANWMDGARGGRSCQSTQCWRILRITSS